MDEGMTRDEALALAQTVRAACSDGTEVSVDEEDDWFVVEVRVRRQASSGSCSSTDRFTLRDEQDWAWLASRIRG